MDNLLYNPPAFKKKDEDFRQEEEWLLGFLPQDFFWVEDDLFVYSGDRLQIFSKTGQVEYRPSGFSPGKSLRVSAENGRAVFYHPGGKEGLLHLGQIEDITEPQVKTKGLALANGDLYRLIDHRGALRVERTSFWEDGGLCRPRPLEELSEARYSHFSISEEGIILYSPTKTPLSGSRFVFLEKKSGRLSPEYHSPLSLGKTRHGFYDQKFYLVDNCSLRVFSLGADDLEEVTRIDLPLCHFRHLSFIKEGVLLLDHNNFLHVIKRGVKKYKMPGNLYGLRARENSFFMIDRRGARILSFAL